MEQQIEDEISLKDLIQKGTQIWKYLLSKWLLLFLIGIMGSGIGFTLAWRNPVKYTARMSFVAEEGRTGGGGLASLAGQFGFDLGGGAGGGIFTGENLLLFLKSEGLIRETLLTSFDSTNKITLADQYAVVNELKESWSKKSTLKDVSFYKYANRVLPRREDSLLQIIIGSVSKELNVVRPDKKASFVEVTTSTRDEALSKIFTERLVATGTARYIHSKTKVKAANVALLQKRADSLGSLLNRNTYSAAIAQQSLVDVNPALRTAPVAAEISTREKMMIATIFAEVTKNLELAKFTLSQETPVIQIVDTITLPLKKEKQSKSKSMFLGGILAGFLAVFYLLAQIWWRRQIA